MSKEADKVTAPAEATDAPSEGAPASVPDKEGAQSASSPDTEARIRELESRLGETTKNYRNLQQLQGRQAAELGELRRLREQVANQTPQGVFAPETPSQPTTGPDPRFDELDMRTALIQFKVDNPDWSKYEGEIGDIVNDPNRVAEYAAYDQSGRVNYGRVLRDIYRDVRMRDLSAERVKQRQAEADSEKHREKARAVISGSGASDLPPTFDMDAFRRADAATKLKMARELGIVSETDPPR